MSPLITLLWLASPLAVILAAMVAVAHFWDRW